MLEHSTAGLPLGPSKVDRALRIVRERGFVLEGDLYHLVDPEGRGLERKWLHEELSQGPLADGTLVMFWTRVGMPYYVSPLHAMDLVRRGRVSWVKGGVDEVPAVNGPSDFELED